MTWWSAAALAFTYPVDPTTMALKCSIVFPFFTVSVCAPDVAPVSPITVRSTCSAPRGLEVHALDPAALMLRRYSACAVARSTPRRPLPPERRRAVRQRAEYGETRPAAATRPRRRPRWPDGAAHDLHSPGGAGVAARLRSLEPGGERCHCPTAGAGSAGSAGDPARPGQTALTGPTGGRPAGACGRTVSPQCE